MEIASCLSLVNSLMPTFNCLVRITFSITFLICGEVISSVMPTFFNSRLSALFLFCNLWIFFWSCASLCVWVSILGDVCATGIIKKIIKTCQCLYISELIFFLIFQFYVTDELASTASESCHTETYIDRLTFLNKVTYLELLLLKVGTKCFCTRTNS